MNSHKRRIINAMAIPLIALGSLAASMIPAQAALGTVLRNSDTGLQGNGRGLAFDGQDLYYTLLGDSNIYRNSTSGGGGSLLGTIGLPFGDPRVMTGGPLAWDGTALWTADYSAALILYRVDPVSGATIGSCDLNAVNPGHPALSGLANPDGMDYDGSTNSIILSGARSPYLAAQANNVAIIDAASCRIASWFVATIGPGGWGTAGVTIDADGTHLWHATSSGPGGAGNHFYQTDFAGVPNGVSFTATVFPPGTPPISPMDMATDINTFSPTCVIWAHEGNGLPIVTTAPPIIKKEHFTAYEVPCPGINHPPACDAGGPYSAECNGGTGTVTLDGTGSSDPDGDALTFAWSSDCVGEVIVDASAAITGLTATGPPPCPVSCIATLKVTDSNGSSATCHAPIGIQDTTSPIATAPGNLDLECSGLDGVPGSDPAILAWLSSFVADDSCSMVTKSNDAPLGFLSGCNPGQLTTVGFTATDACNNATTVSASVTVHDTTPPAITAPAPIMVECTSPMGISATDPAVVAWLALATGSDLCSTANVSNNAPADFASACDPGLATDVTFTATDGCGQRASAVSALTVKDSTPPMISVPAPLSFECTGPGGISSSDPVIAAWLALATGSDLCSNAGVTNDSPSTIPVVCPGNQTRVNFTATDGCNLMATGSSSVANVDTMGPVVTAPARLRIQCDSSNPIPASDPRIAAWLALAAATDLCGAADLVNNADLFPTMCKGPQGVEVFFTGTDSCGNTSQAIGQVKVVDEAEPTLSCPGNLTVACPSGPLGSDPAVAAWIASATTSDVCWTSGVNITNNLPATCQPGTTVKVKFTSTDPCGNMTSCIRSIDFPRVAAKAAKKKIKSQH